MSETDPNREPIELVQITTPRCANLFGAAPCQAGLGDVDTSAFTQNLAIQGELLTPYTLFNNLSQARVIGGVELTSTGANPQFSSTYVGVGEGFSGDDFRYVVLDVTFNADFDLTGSGTRVYYASTASGNSIGGTRKMELQNAQIAGEWRGLKGADYAAVPAGTRVLLVFDAAESTNYATEWQGTEIRRLRVDIDRLQSLAATGDSYTLHSIAATSANPRDAKGTECYNTRATCQDPENYRDLPDRSLSPDLTLATADTIASGDLTRSDNLFFAANVRFGSDPDGVIWELGGSGDEGAYLGVTSGNLVFRAGDASVASGANTGKISVDAAGRAGRTEAIYGEIEFVAGGTCTVRLWRFCVCSKTLVLLGSDTWTDASSGGVWAGAEAGAVGEANATVPTGESSADWNGKIDEIYFYDSQLASIYPDDSYVDTLTLGRGDVGEPRGELYILPCLGNVSTIGTRINIAGSDDDYEPLGRRASISFSCEDFAHSDNWQDPYVRDRLEDPAKRSSFWRKWLVRQKFGRVNASVKVLDGYAGQRLADYRIRECLLDMAQYGEDGISFRARDILSLTEFQKAQVPAPSTGSLAEDMTADALTMKLVGNVLDEYPMPCTVRINDEIIRVDSASYDSGKDETTFNLLAGLSRGSDGSTADEHEVDDLVQLCRRYSNASVSEVLLELLMDDAGIPGQQVDIAGIEGEDELYLSAYKLTTLITEPTSVSKLLGKLSEECSFYIWWDERQQVVRAQAIRAINVDEDVTAEWTYEENIVGGSMQVDEKPKQRLNVIDFYYNPIDFAGDLDQAANFRSGVQVINATSSLPEQYGNYVQSRTIYSRWLSTEAQANQTSSRLALRFSDVPIYPRFLVDAKDRAIWTGDFVTISHPLIVDENGEREIRRYLVVEAEEIDPGHLVSYRLADITLDGLIYVVTENGIGNYTAELFAAGNAFITDNDGLNGDGTQGARLA